MCNTEISKALLYFFILLSWLFNWKTEMVLFASHQAVLKGGGEMALANEVQYMGNFSNTKCNESPAICLKKSQDNVNLLEEMMIFNKPGKKSALELNPADTCCFCRWNECTHVCRQCLTFIDGMEGTNHSSGEPHPGL